MKTLDVAAKIKAFRAQQGLTQKQFAELLGITHQTVSKWERENGYPDVFLLPRIAEALNCTIDELYKS